MGVHRANVGVNGICVQGFFADKGRFVDYGSLFGVINTDFYAGNRKVGSVSCR